MSSLDQDAKKEYQRKQYIPPYIATDIIIEYQMGAKEATDRIYCMYVYAHRHKLAEAWWKFIDVEVDSRRLSDYALALALELAVREGKDTMSKRIAGELHRTAKRLGGDVHWTTANFSRWGNDRHEITAAVMKALVAHDVKDKSLNSVPFQSCRLERQRSPFADAERAPPELGKRCRAVSRGHLGRSETGRRRALTRSIRPQTDQELPQ